MAIKFFSVIALLSTFLGAANCYADEASEYRLRQGDVIHISVWGEKELDKDARVLPDGSTAFPLVGRVEVADLTTPEVEKKIAEKLKTFMPDPQVSVVVSSTAGNRAYVIGKVLKPGPVVLESPMTVLQALSMAGGLDKFADTDEIKVLRGNNGPEVVSVNYDDLIRGKSLDSNVLLNSGDTILVP